MADKRRRQQPRRSGKPKGRPRGADPIDRELTELAELTVGVVMNAEDALEAEQWASGLISTWQGPAAVEQDEPDAVMFGQFVRVLERLRSAPALAGLRALAAVGEPELAERARSAADRLAGAGLDEPSWAGDAGRARVSTAALLHEPAFDDGVTVLLEFTVPSGETYTLGTYIDHNLGGLVKDIFVADAIDEVRAEISEPVLVSELGLDEARARIEAGFEALDRSPGVAVGEDVWTLRALVEARVRLLPGGFSLPAAPAAVGAEGRDALLADFLAAEEGARWRGDADAEYAARLAIDFGADHNHGGPLRWSPVVVEIFLADWLAREAIAGPELLARTPDVLESWVAYAGRFRSVPAEQVAEAVAAVEEYRGELPGS